MLAGEGRVISRAENLTWHWKGIKDQNCNQQRFVVAVHDDKRPALCTAVLIGVFHAEESNTRTLYSC